MLREEEGAGEGAEEEEDAEGGEEDAEGAEEGGVEGGRFFVLLASIFFTLSKNFSEASKAKQKRGFSIVRVFPRFIFVFRHSVPLSISH